MTKKLGIPKLLENHKITDRKMKNAVNRVIQALLTKNNYQSVKNCKYIKDNLNQELGIYEVQGIIAHEFNQLPVDEQYEIRGYQVGGMTTIKGLMAMLKELPEDTIVMMSCDSEGNQISGVSGFEPDVRAKKGKWYAELGQGSGSHPAVILYPEI